MEGGKEANYWPGFVDALSNVVLTLVFVLVIFVFALLMASNKVAKKMDEVVAAEKAGKEGQAQLDKALLELERTHEQIPGGAGKDAGTSQQACLSFSKSDARQKAEIDMGAASVLILFSANAISVTESSTKIISNFVESYRAQNGNSNARFLVESPGDPLSENPLMARETQLGRMLNVRNALMKAKIEPRNISIHDIPPLAQKGGYDWVRVHVEK